jgi:hypothetical protein
MLVTFFNERAKARLRGLACWHQGWSSRITVAYSCQDEGVHNLDIEMKLLAHNHARSPTSVALSLMQCEICLCI